MINSEVHNSLNKAGNPKSNLKCYLIDIENQSNRWTFLINPQTIAYSAQNSFNEVYPYASSKPLVGLSSANVGTLTLANLILTTPGHERSVRPLLQSIDKLRLPLPSNILPPKLALSYGDRIIQPLYLQSVSFTETELLNGEPTSAELTINFTSNQQISF